MNTIPVTMLNGLGCACNNKPVMGFRGFGAVSDYDTITIGGKTYTVNQLIDKTIIAAKETKLYSNPSGKGTVVGTVKAGQPIGKVYSYIKPNNTTSDGRSWLMFDSSTYNKSYYVPNEAASGAGLKEQGTKTVTEELKDEADKKLKDESPLEYYIKKYAGKIILIGGAIYIGSIIVKESFKAATKKKETEPAATT